MTGVLVLDGKGVQLHFHVPSHAILKMHAWYVACLKHCMKYLSICDLFIFYTLLHFELLPSLNALSAHIQLFIYFFHKVTSVFCVPVTCNHSNVAQAIVYTKDHSAPFTSYHINVVQTIVCMMLDKFFFC